MKWEPLSISVARFAPASSEAIAELLSKYPALPGDYIALMRQTNGLEGGIGVEPGWLVLWPVEEVLVASEECGLSTDLPGYVAIGGNGGNELFIISSSLGDSSPVYVVPMIGMSESAMLKIAPNLVALLENLA